MTFACRRDEPRPPTLDEALPELVRAELPIAIQTTEGTIHCKLEPRRVPHSAAMFVGLAKGRSPFRDSKTGRVVSRPYYRGLPVFRAIEDVLFQSGCPVGDGTGTPGYRIAVESSAGDVERLARPGALLLARYHPAPNRIDPAPPPPGAFIGSQFVVTLTDMSHLAGTVPVLGSCRDLEIVETIATLVARAARAVSIVDVVIETNAPAEGR